MQQNYPRIYQDPQIKYPVYDSHHSFADYSKQCEEIIRLTRQDLNEFPQAVQLNAPFELQPTQPKATYGVLLVHGLLDSTFIMRDIGHHLQSHGALVRSVLLPGHGTVPGALLNVDYKQWLQTVKYGVETLKQDVDKVFIAGFSTGANLAMLHAASDTDIAGLILLAPAIKIHAPFVPLSKWMRTIHQWPRAQWFFLTDEIDYVKYQSIPFNAIYQVYQSGIEVKKIGAKEMSHCPMLMITSEEDKIIYSKTVTDYFLQTTRTDNRLLVYSSKSLSFSDSRIEWRNSSYPNKNILHFCHISLPVSPTNFHLGETGDCPYASHYNKNIKYGAFDRTDIFLRNKLCSDKSQYQRLTYNPNFIEMCRKMNEFIDDKI